MKMTFKDRLDLEQSILDDKRKIAKLQSELGGMPEVEIKISGELQAVTLKPGDILLLRFEQTLAPFQRDHLKRYLDETFPGYTCLVLDGGAEVSILRPSGEELNA